MDFDFSIVLVWASAISGGFWLLDRVWWASYRKQRALASGLSVQEAEDIQEPVVIEYSRSFFPIIFLVLVLRSFLFEPFQIPTGSMVPTLLPGDFILVNKFAYGLRLPVARTKIVDIGEPQRGDSMVFIYPGDGKTNYIKRVIGLPGDRIRYANKRLYINGELMPEKLAALLPPGNPTFQLFEEQLGDVNHQIRKELRPPHIRNEWVVKPGHYFMMGDNRDNSNDSRYWGLVSDELVVGKAVAVWMHWRSFFSIPSFARNGGID